MNEDGYQVTMCAYISSVIEKGKWWLSLAKNSTWLLHLLLLLMPLTGLITWLCPQCREELLGWIYEDPYAVSQRTRIVLWTSAFLPSMLVYGYQGLRFWYLLARRRERRLIHPQGVHEAINTSRGERYRRLLFWTVVGLAIIIWVFT